MHLPVTRVAAFLLLAASAFTADGQEQGFFPAVKEYVVERVSEFDQIPDERKKDLEELASFVRQRIAMGEPANLTFICTHNSRRSHLSQLWAFAAADFYGVGPVRTFSGGTESTAFNPRAIAALQRAGFSVKQLTEGVNPRYAVTFRSGMEAQTCFSKVYHESPNPKAMFCAVLTCSDADKNCPLVRGALRRIAVAYEDPKVTDGTPIESQKYDERCAQISREMLYAFSRVNVDE